MKLLWAFLCRSSAIDVETNSISLFNILEDIQIPSIPPAQDANGGSHPLAMGSFELVVATTRDNPEVGERSPARVSLHFPDGSPPETLLEFEIDLTSSQRHRFRLGLPGLPVGGLGSYRFVIEVPSDEEEDWTRIGDAPIDVAIDIQGSN